MPSESPDLPRVNTAAHVPSEAILRRSLLFFDTYRLLIAVLLTTMVYVTDVGSGFGVISTQRFVVLALVYAAGALALILATTRWPQRLSAHLTIGVCMDVIVLVLMMHQAGGARSLFAYLLLVGLAGAGLVGQGRLTLFHAAIASLALLAEQMLRVLEDRGEPADFFYVGVLCIGFFVSAATASLLARRVVANELLARLRGEALAAQLQLNQLVIRDMQDGVLVADGYGNVQQYNPQAISLLGVWGRPLPEMPHLADFAVSLAERFRQWCQGKQEVTEVIRLTQPQRLLRVRFLPPGEHGHALLYIEDMDRIQAQGQQIKLAALGRLAANMAHEIRNPLAAISHASELLAESNVAPSEQRLTHIISDNTLRLNRIVAEILELGRRDRSTPERIALAPFVRMLVEELAMQHAHAAQQISVTLPDDLAINFDRNHLYRVLSNLLQNALRYCSMDSAAVRVYAEMNGERCSLHLIDDGPGISQELHSQVFEPFFTTHSHGTGLGLYIARELCEANGAQLVLLDNAPGAHFCLMTARC